MAMTRTEHDSVSASGEPINDDLGAAPRRSVRRATARRASLRRATVRSYQPDTDAEIVDFVARHHGSTAGDLSRGLNLNANWVSGRLMQLAQADRVWRGPHGYTTRGQKHSAAR